MTGAVVRPLVVVDLSNLCRDKRFVGQGRRADLSLLDRFVDGLGVLDLGEARAHSVADRSLLALLSGRDLRVARSLQQAGTLEFSQVADERLLSLAFGPSGDSEALVASRDNFDDFRRICPAIQGCGDRFLGWEVDDDGRLVRLVVVRRDMGVHDHRRLSRKEESEELKARRLRRDTVVRRAAGHHFRCVNGACLLAQLWSERIPDLPRYDDSLDAFVCPSCLEPLEERDERPNAVQLIVFLHDAEQFRILLEEGESVTIGRRDAEGCIGLATRLPEGTADAVSRSHVRLSRSNGQVIVEDLGSRNGSVLRAAAGDHRLTPGRPQALGLPSTLALPGGVTIERSGRSLPLDGERAPGTIADSTDDRTTRLLTTRW